jgi:signal transduction histidine kinase
VREVSCRILDGFFRELKKSGVPADRLAEGTGYSTAHLRNKNERIEWSAFLIVARNCEAIWSREELVRIGGAWIDSPLFRHAWLITQMLVTPKQLYRWIASLGKQQFECVSASYRELGPQQVEIEQVLDDGYAPCPAFYLLTQGGMAQLPKLVGLGAAHVELTPTERGARYTITLPLRGGVLAFFRRTLKWLFAPRAAARELDDAHTALGQRVMQLEAAGDTLSVQATQLKTALAISGVVNAELDLDKTLEAVASSLTSIARYAGARVSLEDRARQVATSGVTDGAASLILPLVARGSGIGSVEVWVADGADARERTALLETVVPTISLALHSALTLAELRDAQAHLERRVEERTAELVTARDELASTITQLEAAQEARARIFANVNHETRTPLSLIMLTVDELRRDQTLGVTGERALSAIHRNARKLLRLVDGLLLLAADDEDKLTVAPQRTEIGVLLPAIVDSFAASARACSVELRCAPIVGSLVAEVDEGALERMLSNLISNAIKFTPPEGHIVVSAEARGADLVVRVQDDGIGLTDAFMERIFGRFEQDQSPVRGSAGSGIGLSIVRSLAEAHMGSVSVERLEPGTAFEVRLPLRSPLPASVLAREAPRAHQSERPSDFGLPITSDGKASSSTAKRSHSVLVVEDNEELRAVVVNLLAERYQVRGVANAEQALSIAESWGPDMLVTDIGLPGMDGLELTRRFRALPGNRLAPVLVLTAFASLEDRLSGFDAGAVDYLSKPFEPRELLARVEAQLERRALLLRLYDSEKLAAIGTMSAGLAHEIRNPANGIVNAVPLLVEMLPPELRAPESGPAQLISVIEDCSKQIGTLSRQLLGFARAKGFPKERVVASDVVKRAVGIVRPNLKDVELRLDLGYPGDVNCAPALVLQVLSNLLDNAAHAAGAGGWVSLRTFVDGDRFVCEVGDSGPGVPPALRDRIFQPFFTTKPAGEGTGLGLATSRQIADQHGGALVVHSRGAGTVFRFEMPLEGAVGEHISGGVSA